VCPCADFLSPISQLFARIACICKDIKPPSLSDYDGVQEAESTVAVLDTCAVPHETDHQFERVDNDVTLAAFYLFTRIKTADTAAFGSFDVLAVVYPSPWRDFLSL